MKTRDAGFAQKLLHLLQARGTSPEVLNDLGLLGLVISIPADLVLENAGGGETTLEAPANPALGADPIFVVPAGKVWHPLALHAVLTTSATVGMREPKLSVQDGSAAEVVSLTTTHEQAASLAFAYTWARGVPREIDTSINRVQSAMPIIAIPAGYTFRIVTNNIQVGDQWSSVRLLLSSR